MRSAVGGGKFLLCALLQLDSDAPASSKSSGPDNEPCFGKGETSQSTSRVDVLRYDIGTCTAPDREAAVALRDSVRAGRFPGRFEHELWTGQFAMRKRHRAWNSNALRHCVIALRSAVVHLRLRQFHANVDRLTFKYHALAPDGSEHVYLVRRGTVRAERAIPVSASDLDEWDAHSRRIFSDTDPTGRDVPLHDLDEFHLVSSWFRRRPAEQLRTRQP